MALQHTVAIIMSNISCNVDQSSMSMGHVSLEDEDVDKGRDMNKLTVHTVAMSGTNGYQ